jgi:hypothetical protein
VANLRLELDVALRKLQGEGKREEGTVGALPPRAPAAPGRVGAGDTALAPAPAAAAAEDSPEIAAARRYARLVATDIRLYNEDAVVLGRKNGDLTQRLGEHLDRGKVTFLKRHGNLGPAGLGLLHDAYVQILAAGDAQLIPASTLD